jgi:DNA-binding transcriptional LysR family regulator
MLREPAAVELRHLRYFLAVMEELHFGRAAERLHMAQPPLSRAIRKLEDGLGVPLLIRSSRSVVPTEAGRIFAAEARKVLASVDHAVAEARRAGGASTSLRIGYVPYLPAARLQEFLATMLERDEELVVDVTHMYTLEQVRHLRAAEIDLGIFIDAGELHDIATEPLFPGDPVAAFVADSHPLAQRESIDPADMSGETLIVFPRALNPSFYDRWMATVEEAGFRFESVVEATSLNPRDSMLLVAHGRGVGLGPESFRIEGAADVVGVTRCPLDADLFMPPTRIAWATAFESGGGRRLALAREVAADLYGSSVPG